MKIDRTIHPATRADNWARAIEEALKQGKYDEVFKLREAVTKESPAVRAAVEILTSR